MAFIHENKLFMLLLFDLWAITSKSAVVMSAVSHSQT